jgi:hypothetical protein
MSREERKFENPAPEYHWEAQSRGKLQTWLSKIKVGQTLWIRSSNLQWGYSLATVEKITKTLLRCDKERDFYLEDGYERKRWHKGSIVALATEQELADYQAEEQRKNDEAKQRNDQHTALENKCKELSALFGENVYVSKSNWKEGFNISFDGLSEENIRELAARLQVELSR